MAFTEYKEICRAADEAYKRGDYDEYDALLDEAIELMGDVDDGL